MKCSSSSQRRNATVSETSSSSYGPSPALARAIMSLTRRRSAAWSRTTRRTSSMTPRVASSSAAISSGASWRSRAKCMTDSAVASRGWRTATIRPPPSRSVPMIGCTTRAIARPRAASSALTESTRNGRSSVFVSSTAPRAAWPCSPGVGLNARTATGAPSRPLASSNAPSASWNSASGSAATASSGSRRTYSRVNAATACARSGATRSSTRARRRSRSGAPAWGLSSTTPTGAHHRAPRLVVHRLGPSGAVLNCGVRAIRRAAVHDPVDQAELLRLLRREEAIALERVADLLDRPAGVLGVDLLHPPAQGERLAGVDLYVGALALEATVRLMDEDAAVRERGPLALRAAGEQQRAHRHRHAAAHRRDVGLDELHRVVDREAGVHDAARAVDVHRDVAVRVRRLEMQDLGDDQFRDLVVDRRAEEDDPLVEQAAVDVERSLAAPVALDDHGDQRHVPALLCRRRRATVWLRLRRSVSCNPMVARDITIDGDPDEVWEALNDPELLAEWLGDDGLALVEEAEPSERLVLG